MLSLLTTIESVWKEVGSGRLILEIVRKWEVGLKIGEILDFDVRGFNTNCINNITNYRNGIITQPAAAAAPGHGCLQF